MEKVVVTVELSENNYSAYLEDLPGCVSTGKTFDELKSNIREAVDFHLAGMREDGDDIPEQFTKKYQFVFRFDPQSLLQRYNGIFTNFALERITGINQRQLQRYASGVSRPRRPQAEKIEKALHKLGKELLIVEL
ncbi:MAG: type II toxin-antitoxin system HicB family antitoxin [Tannerella sp.]|jgi:predicted RNase H-like HicB family nuclease|nr:type II toxin-antitoxin system HicB family antitoxin [Tannerella sp.]